MDINVNEKHFIFVKCKCRSRKCVKRKKESSEISIDFLLTIFSSYRYYFIKFRSREY